MGYGVRVGGVGRVGRGGGGGGGGGGNMKKEKIKIVIYLSTLV